MSIVVQDWQVAFFLLACVLMLLLAVAGARR